MDWIGITCWAVMGLAAALVLWALLWDRARGRVRCRRCAYDMSGGQLVCPECGREHSSERVLRRTRRKWKTAVLGLLLAMLAIHTKASQSYIEREGVLGVVPSFVLILATDATDYPDYVFGGFEAESLWARTLCERIDANQTSLWTRKLFASKVARGWDGEQVGVQNASAYSVVYDLSEISPVETYTYISPCFPNEDGSIGSVWVSNELSMHVIESVVEHVYPETWVCFGGDESAEFYVGDQLIIHASSDVHALLARHLNELVKNVWSPGVEFLPEDAGDFCFVRYEMDWIVSDPEVDHLRHIYGLHDQVEETVRPDSWEHRGGTSAMHQIGVDMAVWAPPAQQHEIMEYLNSIDLEAVLGK